MTIKLTDAIVLPQDRIHKLFINPSIKPILTRDTKMADLNALKNQLKEQNQRLIQVAIHLGCGSLR